MISKIRGILPALALLALCSCGNGDKKEEPVRLEFQTYSFDYIAEKTDSAVNSARQTDSIDAGENFLLYSARGILPRDIGNSDIKHLRDSLLSVAGVMFTSDDAAGPVVDDGFRVTDREPSSTPDCSEAFSNLSVTLANTKVVVWQCYRYLYLCGAAHGNYSTVFINYSIEKNHVLTMDDLFKPGFKAPLAEILKEKLIEKNVPLFDPDAAIDVPNDFELTSSGVNFIWGLYEIAPYSEGEVKVSVDSFELADLLTDFGNTLFN